jgi:AcrR family transcriptional regulator
LLSAVIYGCFVAARRPVYARSAIKYEHKRRLIVEAAVRVLIRDGLNACTGRAVADETPMTRSAIHYYFESTDELVDAAMDAHLATLLERFRAVGEQHKQPERRFWAVIEDYVAAFAEAKGSTVAWFTYWVQNMDRGRVERNMHMQQSIVEVIGELLADAGADDPRARSRAIFSYLIGAVLRQEVDPATAAELRREVAALSRLNLE